jgi:hypothetical protein
MSVKHVPNSLDLFGVPHGWSKDGKGWPMQLPFTFDSEGTVLRAKTALVPCDEVERLIESDRALVPGAPSALIVEPVLLEPGEIAALLDNLVPLLEASASLAARDVPEHEGNRYESHSAADGRSRGNPKLPAFAWLFSHHAGTGRPTRHQQGHHLRARRSAGKKARSSKGQAQGSLFGDHRS